MYISYKNINDDNSIHLGTLLTNVDLINDYTVYVDIIPIGHIKTKNPDWKNTHIKSVFTKDIYFISPNIQRLKEAHAEHLL